MESNSIETLELKYNARPPHTTVSTTNFFAIIYQFITDGIATIIGFFYKNSNSNNIQN
jgi:hypothetical protein